VVACPRGCQRSADWPESAERPNLGPAIEAPQNPRQTFPDSLSEAAEMEQMEQSLAADAPYRHSNDYFSNTATKGSLGRFPNMVRTFQPVPRTS